MAAVAFEDLRHADLVERVVVRPESPASKAPEAPIASSWRRSLAGFGLRPEGVDAPLVLDSGGVKNRRERFGERLAIARAEMESLYQQIAGTGYAILLTDTDGTILEQVVDPSLDVHFRGAGLITGAVWSEQCEGTNGIGTCIAERQPITVHRGEHFRTRHIGLTCSAAPICDPHGRLLAVLDASSTTSEDTKTSQRHTMALVNMSARLLENCEFLRAFRDQWVLRFHSRPEFVGLLNEAMLAIAVDGRILAANPSAVAQLEREHRTDLEGRPVVEVLDLSLEMLQQRGAQPTETVWPVRELARGRRFFAQLRGPVRPIAPKRQVSLSRPSQGARAAGLELGTLAGNDPTMAYNVRCAERVADRGIPILLQGETGTGKEAFARAIHHASTRASKPFVALNCAAIPETLIESELFGYKHGAFTGSRREGMRGKLLQASGGTLFLDEIGDMPTSLQSRLLRVLEDHEVQPLGCESSVPVELNLICATHRELPSLVAQGGFREDLYYRVNGISLTLPPLRERTDRRELIVQALAAENTEHANVEFEATALALLEAYQWPGNIRQLRNVLRTALALREGNQIQARDLPTEIAKAQPQVVGEAGAQDAVQAGSPLESAEREALLRELDHHRWNVTQTAQALGISRNTLYRKLRSHGISGAGR